MNKTIHRIAYLCLFSLTAWGQSPGLVEGRVLDLQGRLVSEASVRLYSRNSTMSLSTQSDRRGVYRFDRLPPGEYLLEAEDSSSTLGASEEIELDSGARLAHDLHLRIRSVRTEVLVTASSTPLSLQEVAKATDIVDRDQIRRRGEYSIAEAVRNVAGVRVRQQGGPGGFTTIQTRGLRDYDTALLVDGLRFRDAAGTQGDATAFYEDMLVVDTDRVEYLRGSGSSIYGSHAMGGVVNVVSQHGGGITHGEISSEAGGLGFARGLARIGGGLGGVDRFTYSAGISHLNVRDGVDGFDPYRNTSGQGFARYRFTPSVSLSGRVYAADAFGALNESPTFDEAVIANHPESGPVPAIGLPPEETRKFAQGEPFQAGRATFIPAFNDPDNHRAGSFFAGALIFRHDLSPRSSYRISYHGVETGRSFRDGPAGRSDFDPVFSNDSRFDGRVDTVQARTDHRMGERHLITLGYEFEREDYLNLNTDENPDPAQRLESSLRIEQSSHSVFTQDQIRLADGRLQIGLSGRAQWFALDEPLFTGDANPYRGADAESPKTALTADGAIAYFFRSSGTKWRAHVGNSYRAPSSFERFGASFFGPSASFWGDPRLRPERSIAFDTGVDQWLLDSKLRLSGTFFYTELQEVIVFDFGVIDPAADPFGRFGGYRNTGGGLARGLEFSASASPSAGLNLIAAYTYTNSDSRTPTIAGENFFKRLGLSDHTFALTASQRLGRRFYVTFDLFAASQYPLSIFGADRRLAFDGPVKADVVTSYVIPAGEGNELRVFGKVENVFDRRYYEIGFEAPGVWATGGLAFSF